MGHTKATTMTKEECWDKNVYGWKLGMTEKGHKKALEAMDEWALRFGKWLQGCGYYNNKFEEDIWLSHDNTIEKTTEELYQLFLNLSH